MTVDDSKQIQQHVGPEWADAIESERLDDLNFQAYVSDQGLNPQDPASESQYNLQKALQDFFGQREAD